MSPSKKLMFLAMMVFVLPLLSSCYTTFSAVRPAGGTAVYDESYWEDEDDWTGEDAQLSYRPSRMVVENHYYGYGDYLRRVKYVVVDDWDDDYYDDPSPDYYVNIYIGWRPYRPWRPIFWFAWQPYYGWSDSWWCYVNPICCPVPYPIYYPPVVIYNPPYYWDTPYYGSVAKKDRHFGKREWDRRRQVVRRKNRRHPPVASRVDGTPSRRIGRRTSSREVEHISVRNPERHRRRGEISSGRVDQHIGGARGNVHRTDLIRNREKNSSDAPVRRRAPKVRQRETQLYSQNIKAERRSKVRHHRYERPAKKQPKDYRVQSNSTKIRHRNKSTSIKTKGASLVKKVWKSGKIKNSRSAPGRKYKSSGKRQNAGSNVRGKSNKRRRSGRR